MTTIFRRLPQLKRSLFKPLLDAVLPPRCPVTGALVGAQGTLDPTLWAQLTFLHKPFCTCCGNPFLINASHDLRCGKCMVEPPVYNRARAAIKYDDASSEIVLPFKHADKTLLTHVFTPYLLQAGEDLFTDADYLIPVPLHRLRLLKRRYNQAALLSDALSAKTKIPSLKLALLRTKKTESQGHKTKDQRADNVRSAFDVPSDYAEKLRGKNIILVDDVMTSGATVNECAKILLKNGAARVDVLTLARIVHNA